MRIWGSIDCGVVWWYVLDKERYDRRKTPDLHAQPVYLVEEGQVMHSSISTASNKHVIAKAMCVATCLMCIVHVFFSRPWPQAKLFEVNKCLHCSYKKSIDKFSHHKSVITVTFSNIIITVTSRLQWHRRLSGKNWKKRMENLLYSVEPDILPIWTRSPFCTDPVGLNIGLLGVKVLWWWFFINVSTFSSSFSTLLVRKLQLHSRDTDLLDASLWAQETGVEGSGALGLIGGLVEEEEEDNSRWTEALWEVAGGLLEELWRGTLGSFWGSLEKGLLEHSRLMAEIWEVPAGASEGLGPCLGVEHCWKEGSEPSFSWVGTSCGSSVSSSRSGGSQ